MNKRRSVISLILAAVLLGLLVFTVFVGFNGEKHAGSARNIKLGLDLSGGVSITYQVADDSFTAEEMSDTIYKLQKRVEQYSTESNVYQEGDDRIAIEIPGATNANEILSGLGKPGSISFVDPDGEIVISGSDVETASVRSGSDDLGNTEYSVELDLTAEGGEKFAESTEANVGNAIYIVYDDEVISAPTVDEAITGGTAYITGDFTYEEADNLAATIRIGSLSLELTELQSDVVGAQLGGRAIETSLIAGGIGLAAIIIFMIAAYLLPGVAAGIALLIYVGLMMVTLNAFDVTLTLPGIAGIILGIGMAVDANVIIFARVREEMVKGRSARNALREGFHKAMSAILDGNITTLIAAAVLYFLGSGSVRGFAQTLAIGIILSMITSLVITRWIICALYGVGLTDEKLYLRKKKTRRTIRFVNKWKYFAVGSVCVILIGTVVMGVNAGRGSGALALGLEFEGGTSTTAELDRQYTLEEIEDGISDDIESASGDSNAQISLSDNGQEVTVKTVPLSLDERNALDDVLTDEMGADADTISTENISATISSEMQRDAVIAVIVATICMLLYIWVRFRNVRFALSAVIALLHDVLIVLAFYAVTRIPISNTFIACMLTIVGYSINATIVIFDRIRENLRHKDKNQTLEGLVDTSITQTLTRSIYTSATTFIMVFFLFVLGVSSIREFAAPLMAGIIAGAYSSVCITGALWYKMQSASKKIQKKPARR